MRRTIERLRFTLVLVIGAIGITALPLVADAAALYKLPYPAGVTQRVSLGNFSSPHTGSEDYAFDFAMPNGSTIVAARAGTIRFVKEDSNVCGCSSAYGNSGNYIVVDHGDGTQALYLHLQYNGALAKVGESVAQGQPIAKSGMTGWTCGSAAGGCGPHLHFQVERRGIWFTQSVFTQFADVSSNNGVPAAGGSYTSGNVQGASPTPSPSPSPIAGCTGTDCNGKSPLDTSCANDAITASSQTVTFSTGQSLLVELRWSQTCQTNWARAQVQQGSGVTLGVRLEDVNGASIAGSTAQGAQTSLFGGQWFAPTQKTQACVDISGAVKGSACTKPA